MNFRSPGCGFDAVECKSRDQKPQCSTEFSRMSCAKHSDFLFSFFPSSSGKEEEHRQVVFPTVSNIGYHGSLLRKRKNTHTSSLMHPVLPFGQSS